MQRERMISLQELTNLNAPLLDGDKPQEENKPSERSIEFKDGKLINIEPINRKPIKNIVRNQKYSVFTFIPFVLYEQFKHFFNLFYLLTALSQFVPALKVGLMFSFVAPLVLVLSLTMLKQAYEDYQRYRKDKEINSAQFRVLNQNIYTDKLSSDLEVGDILELGAGQSVPADCVILHSLTERQTVFLKTDQLDGETDWKLRKAIFKDKQQMDHFTLEYMNPDNHLYQFLATVGFPAQEGVGLQQEGGMEGVGLENTAWRGVKIASGKCLMIIVFTGKETKLSLNGKQAKTKFGKFDEQINFYSKILFLLIVLLSMMLVTLHGWMGTAEGMFTLFFKYFLLLSAIIPISMKVNLDFGRLVYKWFIDRDPNMTNPLCRNSGISEQLSKIQFILSDKTGTLTKNEMLFKKLYLRENLKIQVDEASQIEAALKIDEKSDGEIEDLKLIREALRALMVCHNVTPVIEENGEESLQGSSPDEIALVNLGHSFHYFLKQRTETYIELMDPQNQSQEYQILDIFPFTSQSKSMGIVVRYQDTQQIVLYLKGADTVIQPKISLLDSTFMLQACHDLAREGLRTLVITRKTIAPQDYTNWKQQHNAAAAALKDREEKLIACRKRLEHQMQFLAVTGVEDKLQDEVVHTVSSARSIGIKFWMLTGDKVETAICIGRAIKLIQGRTDSLFVIQGVESEQEFGVKLNEFYETIGKSPEELALAKQIPSVMVLDGTSLKVALNSFEEEFFNVAIHLAGIICSRVSPTQKAEIAKLVIKYNTSDGRILGIGDGGNDVALIQCSHVGVGIYGKQGIQAALASDFSIGEFKDLNSLLYWHGRLAFKRSASLAQFIIHRGVIISLMQAIFIIEFYFVALPIYNGLLLLGYSTLFTMLPVFSLILDEDITRNIALDYPILYKNTKMGNELSSQSMLYWMFISFYQGSVIMILISLFLGKENFYMVTTVSFTCLILIQFLNIYTELHSIRLLQLISTLISALIYILSIILLKSVLNVVELFTSYCLIVSCIIVAIAWTPPFIFQVIKKRLYPTEEQKMMKRYS